MIKMTPATSKQREIVKMMNVNLYNPNTGKVITGIELNREDSTKVFGEDDLACKYIWQCKFITWDFRFTRHFLLDKIESEMIVSTGYEMIEKIKEMIKNRVDDKYEQIRFGYVNCQMSNVWLNVEKQMNLMIDKDRIDEYKEKFGTEFVVLKVARFEEDGSLSNMITCYYDVNKDKIVVDKRDGDSSFRVHFGTVLDNEWIEYEDDDGYWRREYNKEFMSNFYKNWNKIEDSQFEESDFGEIETNVVKDNVEYRCCQDNKYNMYK